MDLTQALLNSTFNSLIFDGVKVWLFTVIYLKSLSLICKESVLTSFSPLRFVQPIPPEYLKVIPINNYSSIAEEVKIITQLTPERYAAPPASRFNR